MNMMLSWGKWWVANKFFIKRGLCFTGGTTVVSNCKYILQIMFATLKVAQKCYKYKEPYKITVLFLKFKLI